MGLLGHRERVDKRCLLSPYGKVHHYNADNFPAAACYNNILQLNKRSLINEHDPQICSKINKGERRPKKRSTDFLLTYKSSPLFQNCKTNKKKSQNIHVRYNLSGLLCAKYRCLPPKLVASDEQDMEDHLNDKEYLFESWLNESKIIDEQLNNVHTRIDYNDNVEGVNITNNDDMKPNSSLNRGAVGTGLHHKKSFVEINEYEFPHFIHTLEDDNEDISMNFEDELPLSTSTNQFKRKAHSRACYIRQKKLSASTFLLRGHDTNAITRKGIDMAQCPSYQSNGFNKSKGYQIRETSQVKNVTMFAKSSGSRNCESNSLALGVHRMNSLHIRLHNFFTCARKIEQKQLDRSVFNKNVNSCIPVSIPIERSIEMHYMLQVYFNNNIGYGMWNDEVTSQLARPLNAESIYMVRGREFSTLPGVALKFEDKKPFERIVKRKLADIKQEDKQVFTMQLGTKRKQGIIHHSSQHNLVGGNYVFPYDISVHCRATTIKRAYHRRWLRLLKSQTKIASLIRGFSVRKMQMKRLESVVSIKMVWKQYYSNKWQTAALRVQSNFRAIAFRLSINNLIDKKNSATVMIQSIFRGRIITNHYLSLKKKLIVIQYFWRRVSHRMAYRVIMIQRFWRGFKCRSHFRLVQSAIKINSLVRGSIARKHVMSYHSLIASNEKRRQRTETDAIRTAVYLVLQVLSYFLEIGGNKMLARLNTIVKRCIINGENDIGRQKMRRRDLQSIYEGVNKTGNHSRQHSVDLSIYNSFDFIDIVQEYTTHSSTDSCCANACIQNRIQLQNLDPIGSIALSKLFKDGFGSRSQTYFSKLKKTQKKHLGELLCASQQDREEIGFYFASMTARSAQSHFRSSNPPRFVCPECRISFSFHSEFISHVTKNTCFEGMNLLSSSESKLVDYNSLCAFTCRYDENRYIQYRSILGEMYLNLPINDCLRIKHVRKLKILFLKNITNVNVRLNENIYGLEKEEENVPTRFRDSNLFFCALENSERYLLYRIIAAGANLMDVINCEIYIQALLRREKMIRWKFNRSKTIHQYQTSGVYWGLKPWFSKAAKDIATRIIVMETRLLCALDAIKEFRSTRPLSKKESSLLNHFYRNRGLDLYIDEHQISDAQSALAKLRSILLEANVPDDNGGTSQRKLQTQFNFRWKHRIYHTPIQ